MDRPLQACCTRTGQAEIVVSHVLDHRCVITARFDCDSGLKLDFTPTGAHPCFRHKRNNQQTSSMQLENGEA